MQYLIFILIVTFMILLVPLKGSAMGDNPKKIEQIKQDYAKLNLTDGVNKEEALVIAQNFIINDSSTLSSNVNIRSGEVGESGLKEVVGDCWAVGFDAIAKFRRQTGLKWFTVHIDKLTGEIKTTGWGPS
jgi:hypothetical protein